MQGNIIIHRGIIHRAGIDNIADLAAFEQMETSAGYVVNSTEKGKGVFINVDEHDLTEIVTLAKKLDDPAFLKIDRPTALSAYD